MSCGLPSGAFAVVYGEEAGRAAVLDLRIKAGAFTGSTTGGRALFDLANSRREPNTVRYGCSRPAPTARPGPALGVSAADLLAHQAELVVECFGRRRTSLVTCARMFTGELTATVHGEGDDPVAAVLLAELSERAGRVLWNGWPTGVAVTYAMHHGGPYPATTAPLHTSHLLPRALRDGNPFGIPRRIDGALTQAP